MDGVTLKRSQERERDTGGGGRDGRFGEAIERKGTSASPGDSNATDTQMSGS